MRLQNWAAGAPSRTRWSHVRLSVMRRVVDAIWEVLREMGVTDLAPGHYSAY